MAEIDQTKLGVVAADFMERLGDFFANDYPELENPRISEVMVIAHVETGPEDDTNEFPFMHCSNSSRIYQQGLLDSALDRVKEGWVDSEDDLDDEDEE